MELFFKEDGIEVYCGDCREALPHLSLDQSRVAVVSDPPYGLNSAFDRPGIYRKSLGGLEAARRRWEKIAGDDAPFDPAFLLGFPLLAIFGANHYADKLPPNPWPKSWKWLMWDKRRGSAQDSNSDGELVWTNRTGALRIHYQKWRGLVREGEENLARAHKLHPAQKPVSLMRWVIGEIAPPPGSIILDPFCGSGSTLVAAVQLGYRCVGIDLLEGVCEVAVERLRQRSLLTAGVLNESQES